MVSPRGGRVARANPAWWVAQRSNRLPDGASVATVWAKGRRCGDGEERDRLLPKGTGSYRIRCPQTTISLMPVVGADDRGRGFPLSRWRAGGAFHPAPKAVRAALFSRAHGSNTS